MVYRRFSFIFAVCLLVMLAMTNAAQSETPPTMVLKWGTPGTADGQMKQPHSIAMDAAGNVYVADTENHRIQKFGSTGIFLAKWGSSGTGNGQFAKPYGVATDSAGNIYVADTDNNRIQKLSDTGIYLAGWGIYGSENSQFSSPSGIAADAAGNIYVVDSYNHRIQKFTADGMFVSKWGTFGSGDGQLNIPLGIATDSSGNIWVADTGNNRIQKFDSTGNFLAKWGSFGTDNGLFRSPTGIVTDASGNVYVTDKDNNRVQKLTGTGTFLSVWGGYGSTDGLFIQPWGIALDSTGSIYVADKDNNRIQKFAYISRIISVSGDMTFGNVNVGSSSQRTLTITNSGNSPMNVSSITYPTGFTGNWSGSIAAGSSQNVSVTFTPTAVQGYSGTIVVNSDKTSGTETLAISGAGVNQGTRIISVSGDIAFGNILVGSISQRTLTISNSGNSSLTVSSITYPSGFSGSWSGTIAAGASQSVVVTFAPTIAQTYSGIITVNSDKTSGTETIAVSGTGIAIQNTRIISVSGDMAFGNVNVGSTAQRTLTISNTGNSVLTVSSISYPSGFSGSWSSGTIYSGSWNGTIAAGASQSLIVTFAPTAAQNYSGVLIVNSDKTSGTETLSLSGVGIQSGITVIRSFPCYLAGGKLTVTLNAQPAANIGVYAVEDRHPAGWTVSNISSNGLYDAVNGKIKFGPFFDNSSRILTYDVTPPITDNGDKSFTGTVSADGMNVPISGNSVITTCFNHPADISPKDFALNIGEVTAYGWAWKNGTDWSIPPNPIPISYVTRAGALWQGGETYKFDSTAGAAPMCWVNTLIQRSLRSSESTAVRQIVQTDSGFSVSIEVVPSSNVATYAVEEYLPPGWEATSVDNGGIFNALHRQVKFGPFMDHQPRTLSYQLRSSSGSTPVIIGVASFDGLNIPILGKKDDKPGNLDCHGDIDLADAIFGLSVISGINFDIAACGDVNGDKKLGQEEIVYVLQIIAGVRVSAQ